MAQLALGLRRNQTLSFFKLIGYYWMKIIFKSATTMGSRSKRSETAIHTPLPHVVDSWPALWTKR
jgi:hypothetical protein